MKVYFPDFYTECHRTAADGLRLANLLAGEGITCSTDRAGCSLTLCGSIFVLHKAVGAGLPTVYYNWDLYPWQVKAPRPTLPWRAYVHALRTAREIWVPNRGTAVRTAEFTERDSVIIKPCYRPWEPASGPGGCVVDVMRPYTQDPCYGWVKRACDDLGLPCVETRCSLPWDQYRAAVGGARLLVSAYHEASTGGLSLLEGYHHGAHVLVNDSPFQGANDLFGGRVWTFKDGDFDDLKRVLKQLWDVTVLPTPSRLEERREWLTENYSETTFAKRVAARLKEIAA
jgi:hypothetical protein